jgi:hypothetical protein
MSNYIWDIEDFLDNYDLQIEKQERDRVITFINSVIMDLEKFNDSGEDLKAIVKILESEDWALGY